jgi:hypothetical protein
VRGERIKLHSKIFRNFNRSSNIIRAIEVIGVIWTAHVQLIGDMRSIQMLLVKWKTWYHLVHPCLEKRIIIKHIFKKYIAKLCTRFN